MRKGKIASQAAHASMAVLLDLMKKERLCTISDREKHVWTLEFQGYDALDMWLNGAFTKICVYVNSEKELKDLYEQAKFLKLPCSIIEDSGKTEFNNVPTFTAMAIGPEMPEVLDSLTGGLPLL
ncbi:MAG: hypothetical protein KA802_09190 [Saprospiraceae bacterium]|nr:hypothetical protein [Saprospiraceae bacterium]